MPTKELFLQIVNMSFTGSLVILAVLLLRLPLKKAPKIYTYLLWALVLFRLLCPFSFEFSGSQIPAGQLIEPQMLEQPQFHISSGINALDEPVNTYFDGTFYEGVTVPTGTKQDIADTLAVIWLGGICVITVGSIISLLRLKKRLVGAVKLRDNIYLADNIDMPFALGVLAPKIYLPSTLQEQEMPYIILHEQTHLSRGDHIVKLLAFAALALHWFNPLVWLAFRLSMLDMEMSCDELVLRKMPQDVRCEYSQSLLRLSGGGKTRPLSPLAFGESDPAHRIKNLLNYRKPTLWLTVSAVVLVIAGVLLLGGNKPLTTNENTDIDRNFAAQLAAEEWQEGITPELREAVFDFAAKHHWAFLPEFTAETKDEVSAVDYLFAYYADNLVWEGNDIIESPDSVTLAEVQDYATRHFGAGELNIKPTDYMKPFFLTDGVFTSLPTSWWTPPYYELTKITAVPGNNGETVYTLTMSEYYMESLVNVYATADEDEEKAVQTAQNALKTAYNLDENATVLEKQQAVRQMIINGDTEALQGLRYQDTEIIVTFSLPPNCENAAEDIFYISHAQIEICRDNDLFLIRNYVEKEAEHYVNALDLTSYDVDIQLHKVPQEFAFDGLSAPLTVYGVDSTIRFDDPKATAMPTPYDIIQTDDGYMLPLRDVSGFYGLYTTQKGTALAAFVPNSDEQSNVFYNPDKEYSPFALQIALQQALEAQGLISGPTFSGDGGNNVLVYFPLSTGETCHLLLSQPATQGEHGIWCVERWKDGNNHEYFVTVDTDQTVEEYYAALQAACDNGHQPALLDPEQVALQFINGQLYNTAQTGVGITSRDLVINGGKAYPMYLEQPVSEYFGYITKFAPAESSIIHLDKALYLTATANPDKLKELGIDADKLDNGYYIHNPQSWPYALQITDNTEYKFFKDGSSEYYTTTDAAEFAAYLAKFDGDFQPPFWVTTVGPGISKIEQQYLP